MEIEDFIEPFDGNPNDFTKYGLFCKQQEKILSQQLLLEITKFI